MAPLAPAPSGAVSELARSTAPPVDGARWPGACSAAGDTHPHAAGPGWRARGWIAVTRRPLSRSGAQRGRRDLDREGAAISFQSVAQRAGVSRQWLYTQPALRAEIERLREHRPTRSDGVPARQRATEASLRQRLETLRAENQRLREENADLKTELAIAYGQQRGAERR
jgi:hypothetical protein